MFFSLLNYCLNYLPFKNRIALFQCMKPKLTNIFKTLQTHVKCIIFRNVSWYWLWYWSLFCICYITLNDFFQRDTHFVDFIDHLSTNFKITKKVMHMCKLLRNQHSILKQCWLYIQNTTKINVTKTIDSTVNDIVQSVYYVYVWCFQRLWLIQTVYFYTLLTCNNISS